MTFTPSLHPLLEWKALLFFRFFNSFLNFLISRAIIVYVWRQTLSWCNVYWYVLFQWASIVKVEMWFNVSFETRTFFLCWFRLYDIIVILLLFSTLLAHSLCCLASLILFPIFQRYWFLKELTSFLFFFFINCFVFSLLFSSCFFFQLQIVILWVYLFSF